MLSVAGYLVRCLVRSGGLVFDFGSGYLLSSGVRSYVYIDVRSLLGYLDCYGCVCDMLSFVIRRGLFCIGGVSVCGVATGGISYGVGVGVRLGLPISYCRVSVKGYGRDLLVEGYREGCSLLLVDDVVSTGRSLCGLLDGLVGAGYSVVGVVCVVCRDAGVYREVGRRYGVRCFSLVGLGALLEESVRQGLCSAAEAARIKH